MKFTEAQLEEAFIELLGKEEMDYSPGAAKKETGTNTAREPRECKLNSV